MPFQQYLNHLDITEKSSMSEIPGIFFLHKRR